MGELIFLNSDKYIAKKVAGTPKRSIFAADYYAIIRLITFKKKVTSYVLIVLSAW